MTVRFIEARMVERHPDPHARQGRLVAIVIVATMLIWIGAQFVWTFEVVPQRFHFLVDFAALGGFAWALITSLSIWRARQRNED